MKQIFVIITLIVIIYFVGSAVITKVGIFTNNASLVISGFSKKEIQQSIVNYYNSEILGSKKISNDAEFDIRVTDIRADTKPDIVTIAKDDLLCGSGGCVVAIFIQNENREFTPIKFGYAVKEIEVMGNITNGMHDLKINKDSKSILIWNGDEYTLNQI